jgi:hypothetical protein
MIIHIEYSQGRWEAPGRKAGSTWGKESSIRFDGQNTRKLLTAYAQVHGELKKGMYG